MRTRMIKTDCFGQKYLLAASMKENKGLWCNPNKVQYEKKSLWRN